MQRQRAGDLGKQPGTVLGGDPESLELTKGLVLGPHPAAEAHLLEQEGEPVLDVDGVGHGCSPPQLGDDRVGERVDE